jgi:hypothetical protein
MNRPAGLDSRNCRNWLTSSRVRRQAMTERLTKQWQEIRRHATIEKDSVKLLRLADERDKRKLQEAFPSAP